MLDAPFSAGYMSELDGFLCGQLAHGFYPDGENIFNAFDATPLDSVNVVILGRIRTPHKGLATGLALVVPVTTPTNKRRRSLRAIFEEIENDGGAAPKANSDLMHWTGEKGVLLLHPGSDRACWEGGNATGERGLLIPSGPSVPDYRCSLTAPM